MATETTTTETPARDPLALLEEIRGRAQAATPGPWIWRGNIDNGDPYLTSAGQREYVLPDGTTGMRHAGDVLGHVRHEITRAEAIRRGVGDPDILGEVSVPDEPAETLDKRLDEAWEAAKEQAVTEYLTDEYGEPRREHWLAFVTGNIYVTARSLAVFDVAPDVTDREDPRVYRADITGIRHPDAEFIAHSRTDIARLLKGYDALLKLADEFAEKSAKLWEQIAELPGSEGVGASLRACTASAYQNAATGIRSAIAAALSAEETAP